MTEEKPYKITNRSRSKRLGVVVSSFKELMDQARELFGVCTSSKVKIVLECDGTEVNEKYFRKLREQTCFMILNEKEGWIPYDHSSSDTLIQRGNEEYNSKDYSGALEFYNQAIDTLTEYATYYSNRAACYIMLGEYNTALEDARISVTLNTKFVKGYIRLIKCCINIGEIAEAEKTLEIVLKLDPTNPSILTEQNNLNKLKTAASNAELSFKNKNYSEAISHLDKTITLAKSCTSFKIMKAECLVFQKRFQEAQDIVLNILNTIDMENVDAMYIQGLCMYYMDKIDQAFTNFQHVMELAPGHSKTIDIYEKAKILVKMKEKGNEAYKNGKLKEAYDLYTDALTIDPMNDLINSKLYFNRATVSSKLGNTKDSLKNCSSALKLDDKYVKALICRAKCYVDLELYDDAVLDYEKAYSLMKNEWIRLRLNEAKLLQNGTNRKYYYYKILGIQKNASFDEIKKAYHKCALLYHPDRHVNATEAEKKAQERKFKALSEAYNVLSDPNKRWMYDYRQDCAYYSDYRDDDVATQSPSRSQTQSQSRTQSQSQTQKPVTVKFTGFTIIHPNSVKAVMMQKLKGITSIYIPTGQLHGYATFENQTYANDAIRDGFSMRYNRKEYQIIFT